MRVQGSGLRAFARFFAEFKLRDFPGGFRGFMEGLEGFGGFSVFRGLRGFRRFRGFGGFRGSRGFRGFGWFRGWFQSRCTGAGEPRRANPKTLNLERMGSQGQLLGQMASENRGGTLLGGPCKGLGF